MKCSMCNEKAYAHQLTYENKDEVLCIIHARDLCPEYEIDCPHCNLQILVL